MAASTGRRRGRPAGAKNKRTVERQKAVEAAAAQLLSQAGGEVFEGDAHALMMLVYKSAGLPLQQRLDAAKSAIAYEKPRLAAIEHTGKDGGPIETADVSDLEKARRIAFLLTKGADG